MTNECIKLHDLKYIQMLNDSCINSCDLVVNDAQYKISYINCLLD